MAVTDKSHWVESHVVWVHPTLISQIFISMWSRQKEKQGAMWQCRQGRPMGESKAEVKDLRFPSLTNALNP